MRFFAGETRKERVRSVSTVVAGVTVPAILAMLAIINPGVKIAEVDLNDGAVWVTNAQGLKLGRYNAKVQELNGGLIASDPGFDVLQDAQTILVSEPTKLSVVDPATVTLTTQAEIPARSQVSMGAGVVAVVGPDGAVWVRTAASLESIDAVTDADLDLGDGARAVVTTTGTVLAFDPADGTVHRVELAPDGLQVSEVGSLKDAAGVVPEEVTAVGDTLVMRAGSRLYGDGWTRDFADQGASLVLQQTGPGSRVVLAATTTRLLSIDLDKGSSSAIETKGNGLPARPVALGACIYGAWASTTGNYVSQCGGADPELVDLAEMTAADTLVFRVNRSVIVLNDTAQGRMWLPDDLPQVQNPNWDDIEQEEEPEDRQDESDSMETVQQVLSQCTEQSLAPGASDDEIGVRPGRTAILEVLGNDTAGECGIIAISEFEPIPAEFGRIESIYGGRALQIEVAPDARGAVTFTYTITDGRGQNPPSTATVTLTARDDSENNDPVEIRKGSAEVEQGATIEYDALANFTDPDGDDLVLVSATTDGTGTVRARQDGVLTFIAEGDQLGRQTLQLVVSDGTAQVTGTMTVDVRAAGSVPPRIDPVHAVTYVGSPVDVDVLASVHSASREPARLATVDEVAGTTIATNLDDGRFTFTATNPGTYYVGFTVVAAPQQAVGLARIDVREWPSEPLPPVAVRDIALLPAGGEVTIDPLANDVDPGGGVLVLTSMTTQDGSALQVAVLDHRLVRITSRLALTVPETVSYVISNGVAEARGEILVVPVQPSSQQRAPVVRDLDVSVRTGGVVTIEALAAAFDADGDTMTLVPELPEPLSAGQGLLFASGDTLRYQAPDSPMTVRAVFSVRDSAGNVGSGQVTISVHASAPESKAPPQPKNLTARTFAGETVRIPVPLTGIDGDGDGVTLLGQGDTAPLKGRIVAIGADWIDYEALPGETGTDTFTYAVEDWVGQRALGTVRVGIATRPSEAMPIVARNDEVTVQPGQRVEVRVLRNDVDPSGGELTLLDELVVPEGVSAHVEGRRIVVDTPATVTDPISITYTVTNERGGQASAVLTLFIVANAVIAPPIAGDVIVAPLEVVDKSTVEVNVLAVAENPSGPMSDIAVSVPSSHASVASVTASGGVLVTLTDRAETIPYLLTNTRPEANGAKAYAFISVPALGDFPPILRPKARELRVASGAELVIPIAEFVQVGTGKTARIGAAGQVSATRSDGSDLIVDEATLRFVSAPGYAGPASVTFQVTDGSSRDDANGRRATLTLPITVYTEDDFPPTFTPQILDIGQGDVGTTANLLAYTKGPQGADAAQTYTYRLAGAATAGFVVTIDGTKLSVSVAADVPRGTVGAVPITLGYGRAGTMDVQVSFKVTASGRVLATASAFNLVGNAGEETRVDVLTGSSNPFPGEPLSVVGATVVTGTGTAVVSGSSVLVRPTEGFVGELVVRYRLRDATNDALREVEGKITVVVRDKPATPAAPRVGDVTSQTVVLAWDAPANNGTPITGYRVTRGSGQTTACATTTCTITGLTNGTDYTFTVAAQNAVGWSAESPPSAKATPDAVPDTPGAPTLTAGDGQITVNWTAPANQGTPIEKYTVMLSGGGAQSKVVSATSVTFTGLANGTGYTAQVRAHNKATPAEGGPWSPSNGQPVTPAGLPGAPTVTAQRTNDVFGGAIKVAWTPGSWNGDSSGGFTVTMTGQGTVTRDYEPGATSDDFTAVNGVTYTFSVVARNKAGTGPAGTATAQTYGTPGKPVAGTTTPINGRAFGDGQVQLNWSAPAETGGVGIAYYLLNDTERVTSTSAVKGGLPGGTASPTYTLVACNTKDVCGDEVTLGSATPLTKPAAPSVTVAGGLNKAIVSWVGNGNGNGGADVTYQYALGSSPDVWSTASGTSLALDITLPDTENSRVIEVLVRAVNSEGQSPVGRSSGTVTRPREPNAPTSVDLTGSGPKTLNISWPNAEGNGTAVSKYRYRIVRGGTEGDWVEVGLVNSVSITGVDAGQVKVDVQAYNGAGAGWSPSKRSGNFTVEAEAPTTPDPGTGDGG
ncbi:Fibronectin type III domain-containing protein [Sanguibacter gelidistatuariae]|uniref:Fibronectin type III domain-containing protein n=1 Tax=Sanguibacter gelidistatuariae TaxID=1814289 RepID=A0A1G6UPE8_9MICO|nr:Ig-like domain-containing protein [Sanguibacter gelidistatuariae]SDD43163.1 Fibronectin type III domain-containing protein [Sanguibacter gelidistatuariae]